MTNVERCVKCGAVIALVGLRHNCVEREAQPVPALPDVRGEVAPGTYRYRNDDEWRAYMRTYMRGYRARKKSSGAAAARGL